MYQYHEIKQIQIELTQRCQASCPMCDRNILGGVTNPHVTNAELSLDDCKQMFSKNFIEQLRSILMIGVFGDPIIAQDTLEICQYFREHNPTVNLVIITNGGARPTQWWKDIANVIGDHGYVVFSVDGLKDTNHIYRRGVIWENVERNIKTFCNAGGIAQWAFLVFKHNQHQVVEAEQLAKEWGVDKFFIKRTGRFFTVRNSITSTEQIILDKGNNVVGKLEMPYKEFQNPTYEMVQQVSDKYGSMEKYYDVATINCKVNQDTPYKEIYISAEGIVLPCCSLGARMYKWWIPNIYNDQLWQHINKVGGKNAINAKYHTIQEIFDTGFFTNIKNSWSLSSCKDGKLKACSIRCGTEFDAFAAQFQSFNSKK